jgi:hypothetical protein
MACLLDEHGIDEHRGGGWGGVRGNKTPPPRKIFEKTQNRGTPLAIFPQSL